MNVTANCSNCGAPVQAADDTPDNQMLICGRCGTELGTYGDIRKAMIDKGVAEIEGAVGDMIKGFNKR